MRMRAALLVTVAAACGGTSASPSPASPAQVAAQSAEVTRIADEVLAAYIQTFPSAASLSGLPGAPDDGLEDNSLTAIAAWQAREDAWHKRLAAIDGNALWGSPAWLTHGLLREYIDASRGFRVCRKELWPVNQFLGWQSAVFQLAEKQRVGTPELRKAALARWRLIPRYLDNEIANAREGLRLGYSTPRLNVDLVIKQLDDLLKLAPRESPFFAPAKRDPELAATWEALLSDQIYPAIRRMHKFLVEEYRDRARTALGVAANPNGVACYRASFRRFTTLDRDPEETFRLGEQTVARNVAETKALAQKAFGTSDLPAIVKRLRDDPANHFGSRDELLAFTRAAVERARAAMDRVFPVLPKTPVIVEPVPAFLEPTASDSYERPSADGSRPGVYRINLGHAAESLRSNTEVTAFHETYPGHHLQIASSLEATDRHPVSKLIGNSAYTEGWARYAEALAEEIGLYSNDVPKIHRRLWPARGMVIDPGLHLRGWTPEQAIKFGKEAGRFTDQEVAALVPRVTVWPAQLTAYDTGGLEIRALRTQAEAALGARFDLRRFHQAALANGIVTLPMLRTIIERWIADEKAR